MKNKLLYMGAVILTLLSFNAVAANQDFQVNFINHADTDVQVVATPSMGDVNNGEAISVKAHSTSPNYDVNTNGFTGGALQAVWMVATQQIACPPVFLPDDLNGQFYTFVLNYNKTQGYSCAAIGLRK